MKTKIAALALAAVTLTAAIATSSDAQARPRWGGAAVGLGIAGVLIGAAAASNAYGGYYAAGPSYRECRYVERFNAWGHRRLVRICDVY